MKGNLRLIGGRKIQSPKGLGTRPTCSITRESLINILGERIYNSDWLDLFSGSGVIGCEALQNGAKRILAIESNKKTAQICKSNLLNISSVVNHCNHVEVRCKEVVSILKAGAIKSSLNYKKKYPNNDHKFDFIYLDPPYDSLIYTSVLNNLLKGEWVKSTSTVIYEHNSNISIATSNEWTILDNKTYGKSGLLFITPNLA